MSSQHPLLLDGPESGPLLILAHGAGAPMDSDFMNRVSSGLAERGVRVVRFEFPYMRLRREDGKKRPPNGQGALLQTWRAVFAEVCASHGRQPQEVVIGGKSMGGRMASLLVDALGAGGLVCLGYPFHPPGKPEKTRTDHLETLGTRALIAQGTRDALGNRKEVAQYQLSAAISIVWLDDGDHSFKPRKSSGRTLDANLADAIAAAHEFLEAPARS